MVAPANTTLQAIERKIRRLIAAPSQSALTTSIIQEYVNDFYNNDFPYAIKLDQTRSVYSIYTSPHVDRYPLDVNNNQGIRDPVYFEGIQGQFFKDRQQFYNMWTRFPTRFNAASGDGVTTTFNFTLPGPFLAKEVTIGSTAVNGSTIRICDDGGILSTGGNRTTIGNLLLVTSDSVGNAIPPIPPTSPIPITSPLPEPVGNNIGTVNYVTGQFSFTLPVAFTPAAGSLLVAWVSQYQTGRPYCLLFWNNEFIIRPIPDLVIKIEVESYLTPSQFIAESDNPLLKQWWEYIAVGSAIKICEDRQDLESVKNLSELFDRQEALVLERQGTEEIGQRNSTIFSATIQNQNYGAYSNWY
jgi:hypothetical protein